MSRSSPAIIAAGQAASTISTETITPRSTLMVQAVSKSALVAVFICTSAAPTGSSTAALAMPKTLIAMAIRPKSSGIRRRAAISVLARPSRLLTRRPASSQEVPFRICDLSMTAPA